MPAIWLLGSSGYSAQLAGMLGLPFSFAHHFSSTNTIPALQMYRENFRASQWLERPYAMVAVSAGWAWPSAFTAMPAAKSSMRRPSVVSSHTPSPRAKAIGARAKVS